MFSKFDLWQYRSDNNCWDFVREFLIERGVPCEDIPKYGIAPSNKKAMTGAHHAVKKMFVESGPVQNAIACHYHGGLLLHVGVVDGGHVRHTGEKIGTRKDPIDEFCKMAATRFYLHRLWQR